MKDQLYDKYKNQCIVFILGISIHHNNQFLKNLLAGYREPNPQSHSSKITVYWKPLIFPLTLLMIMAIIYTLGQATWLSQTESLKVVI